MMLGLPGRGRRRREQVPAEEAERKDTDIDSAIDRLFAMADQLEATAQQFRDYAAEQQRRRRDTGEHPATGE
jgi:hypothetical protein